MTEAAASEYREAPTKMPVLALDVGGTKLAAGVVRKDGVVLASAVRPTWVHDGVDAVLERLFRLGDQVLAEAALGPGALLGTGIGCGGPLDSDSGVLLRPPHLPGFVDVPVVELAQDRFGLPAVLDNDGTAGALAARWGVRDRTGPGKTVWAECSLEAPAPSTVSFPCAAAAAGEWIDGDGLPAGPRPQGESAL